jgi:hypothetical protein
VKDKTGNRVASASVIAFPAERAQWSGYGFTPPRTRSTLVDQDSWYRFTNLPAGDYYFIAVDVLDSALEVTAGTDVPSAVLTFTGRHTQLDGTLLGSPDTPVDGYSVLVFSADRLLWTPGSRRVRHVRPSSDGHFGVSDLPAGDYLIAAVEDVDTDAPGDPAFFGGLVARAASVSLGDGERRVQDIKVSGGLVPR